MSKQTNPSIPGPSQVNFKGTAGEYFGFWIVNVSVSIITIGIYSAWAKVKQHTSKTIPKLAKQALDTTLQECKF